MDLLVINSLLLNKKLIRRLIKKDKEKNKFKLKTD
jgi:hypothetical protein